jgi:beta-aspartyl-peptidase (threonine type)
MEETPHVLIAGHGAERLAAELGEQPADQRTEEALRRWRERFDERGLTPGDETNLREVAGLLTRPVNLQDKIYKAARVDTQGTVNFLVQDQSGDLASAVSTSGIAWKYPGRIGDSPLIGPGNYCDNRYGAAACTGMGELAIRAGTALSVVLYMKMGMSLREAGLEALRDLQGLASRDEQ